MDANAKTYSLSMSADGSPFFKAAAKSGINPDTLAISSDGSPWWGLSVSGITRRLKAYISGSWVAKPLKYFNGSAWVEKELKQV